MVLHDFTYQAAALPSSRMSVAVDALGHAADAGGGSVVETSGAGRDYEIGTAADDTPIAADRSAVSFGAVRRSSRTHACILVAFRR